MKSLIVTFGYRPQQQDAQRLEGVSVSINSLLQLQPPHLETTAWQLPTAVRLLQLLDLMCLVNSIMVNGGVLALFGPRMTAFQMLLGALYFLQAVLQLGALLLKPEVYQRYRFKVTLINRCLRLASVTMSSATMTTTEMRRFLSVLSSTQQPHAWLSLLRTLLGMPLFYLNHANYVLPFAYVLPAQLWTLLANMMMVRVSTCIIATNTATLLQLSQRLCQCMKLAMHYLVLLGLPPGDAAVAAAAECQGVDGLILLTLYAQVFLLVLIPCLVVYFVELDLKLGFIKQHRLLLMQAYPCLDSRLCKGLIVYSAVVGSWLACEVAVTLFSPMECDSSGMLVRRH